MTYKITRRQKAFIDAKSNEVLFGGAAGGGKSFGQLMDAMLFALRYAGSRQLILRRTLVELERTLVFGALALYPKSLYSYSFSRHIGTFANGSTVEFGYCDSRADALHYQSAEYDVIRFDELTHFTEEIYTYLISRVRGANGFPKQVKSTTNPGGVGHEWVKRRFIDAGESEKEIKTPTGTRIFLKANVRDNFFLMKHDPNYVKRLENLSEKDRLALLEGEWNIEEGRYFSEWSEKLHVGLFPSHKYAFYSAGKDRKRSGILDFCKGRSYEVTYTCENEGRRWVLALTDYGAAWLELLEGKTVFQEETEATPQNQENIEAVKLQRDAFRQLLAQIRTLTDTI